MPDLLTPEQVAEEFGGGRTARWVLESRLRYGWPCVQVGRVVRFTPEQVAEILRRHTVTGESALPAISGQTARSAARSS